MKIVARTAVGSKKQNALVTNSGVSAPQRSDPRHAQGPGSDAGTFCLTRNGQKEVERRHELLAGVAILRARGLTKEAARKKMGVSAATLWRWERRLAPLTAYCGRRSALDKLRISVRVVSRVQRLQLRGMSNAAAWRYYCGFADCPKGLARLRKARSIPPSLLAATRLHRIKSIVLIGHDFAFIQTSPKAFAA